MKAAEAKGYAEGTVDRVSGVYDQVAGAITGNDSREASGKVQHQQGIAKQEINS